jgi:homoserine dehydrogenase
VSGIASSLKGTEIRNFNLCFLGFGNVNRTLVRLLHDRRPQLEQQFGVSFRVTGIASRRLGWIADPNGFDPASLLAINPDFPTGTSRAEAPTPQHEVRTWLAAAHADVLFEATSLDVERGQPAIDYIRGALEHGAHVITANKGPVVHAYRELRDLAAARGKKFLFESTVMDGVPIFSLFDQLPAIEVKGFYGVLNSTTNVILGEIEAGLSFDGALKKAQELGVAEADATHDIDGWDAAVKTAAVITVVMDCPVRLDQIAREGIRDLTEKAIRTARRDGWPYKLVCRARRTASGIEAGVGPEKVLSSQPIGRVSGTSSYIYFETDIFPGLALTEENPGLYATAYGLLTDFVRAVK